MGDPIASRESRNANSPVAREFAATESELCHSQAGCDAGRDVAFFLAPAQPKPKLKLFKTAHVLNIPCMSSYLVKGYLFVEQQLKLLSLPAFYIFNLRLFSRQLLVLNITKVHKFKNNILYKYFCTLKLKLY